MKRSFKYDVFISYKRKGGTPWAELLFLALDKIKEKNVFIDRHCLKGGFDKSWEDSIKEAIESSTNVIVVVFPGIQDVIIEEDDFFIKEISTALDEKGKRRLNIIPFYVEGLSSKVIHSSEQYKSLPEELKTITSPDYEDVKFDYQHPYAWIDDIERGLISEDVILEEYCYRIQVNALAKMIVYDDSHSINNNSKNKIRSLEYNGADTMYWVEKENGYIVLRFEAEDGCKYKVTIDTTSDNESKTPRENSAYYNLKKAIPPDGLFRMENETIILTVDWDMIKLLRSEKAATRTIEKIMPTHKNSELPLIDDAFENLIF